MYYRHAELDMYLGWAKRYAAGKIRQGLDRGAKRIDPEARRFAR
jgi:hypothetical protein